MTFPMYLKPAPKSKKKFINDYVSKLKKNNNNLLKALKEEKRKVKSLTEDKLILESKLIALQEKVNQNQTKIDGFGSYIQDTFQAIQNKLSDISDNNKSCANSVEVCQNSHTSFLSKHHFVKRRATSNPNRQIVQPMVGGFTIQRPIIQLPRINIRMVHNHLRGRRLTSDDQNEELNTHINLPRPASVAVPVPYVNLHDIQRFSSPATIATEHNLQDITNIMEGETTDDDSSSIDELQPSSSESSTNTSEMENTTNEF